MYMSVFSEVQFSVIVFFRFFLRVLDANVLLSTKLVICT